MVLLHKACFTFSFLHNSTVTLHCFCFIERKNGVSKLVQVRTASWASRCPNILKNPSWNSHVLKCLSKMPKNVNTRPRFQSILCVGKVEALHGLVRTSSLVSVFCSSICLLSPAHWPRERRKLSQPDGLLQCSVAGSPPSFGPGSNATSPEKPAPILVSISYCPCTSSLSIMVYLWI